MDVQHLEIFKSKERNDAGSVLKVWKIIKDILLKIKKTLENSSQYTRELDLETKEILTKAYMLDAIFNPLKDKTNTTWDLDWLEWFDFTSSGMWDLWWSIDDLNEWIENEIYYHTPSIWVFFQWTPLFLNHNYVAALWAKNEETLKQDIIDWIALDKYYDEWSAPKAKLAVSKLLQWEWYKDLILKTKERTTQNGKIIPSKTLSWNSFWNVKWLEIRIWNDLTEGSFNKNEASWEWFEWLHLETGKFILTYTRKINGLISLDNDSRNKLIIFWYLSTILDKIWNNWQFLMNVTIEDSAEYKMDFNTNYSSSLKRNQAEIEQKIKDWTLWPETYDTDSMSLIKWLMICLKDDWYYVAEFPLKDKDGKSKIYSWLRFLIQDKDFNINRTFWIGTNAISKDNAELRRFLKGWF